MTTTAATPLSSYRSFGGLRVLQAHIESRASPVRTRVSVRVAALAVYLLQSQRRAVYQFRDRRRCRAGLSAII